MNWAQFMDKWRWSKADYDGVYGAQCVDLFNYYNRDVVGAPFYWCDGAADLWNNIPIGHFYERIENTPDGVPQPGDVVIWRANGKLTGPAGHVAIATGRGDINNFQSFDENWPLGSAAHEQWHTYDDVIGWFRPIDQSPAPVTPPEPVVAPVVVEPRPVLTPETPVSPEVPLDQPTPVVPEVDPVPVVDVPSVNPINQSNVEASPIVVPVKENSMDAIKSQFLSKKFLIALISVAYFMLHGQSDQALAAVLTYLGVQGAIDHKNAG